MSEQVAKAMAEGAKRVCNTTYAVSTTGIAGPGGGTLDKPVEPRLVWRNWTIWNRCSHKANLIGNREDIRQSAAELYYIT